MKIEVVTLFPEIVSGSLRMGSWGALWSGGC